MNDMNPPRPDKNAAIAAKETGSGAASGNGAMPWLKLGLELGPLAVFFAVNAAAGIFWATGIFMVVMLVALGASYALTRHLAPMPVVTALFVLVFGGLTLWLHDETFIKIKPTLVYTLFALTLIGGQLTGRPLLKPLLGAMLSLTDAGWRGLTWRWALFFAAMALANEAVWRNVSTDAWVSFKAFGFLPLTFIFAAVQTPFLNRHAVEEAHTSDLL